MGGKGSNGSNLVRAYASRFAVTTIFWRQNQPFRERIVVALRPSVIPFCLQQQQFFGRQRSLLIGFIQVGPIRAQLVASMLSDKHSPAWVDGKTFGVANSRREALSPGEGLVRL